jgi:hypothetical protein
MKYMLMMNTPCRSYEILNWSESDFSRHMAFMREFNHKLREAGEFVLGEGLSGPEQARRVRADKDGQPITDGVFPESKEFLAGFWIVDVESPDRAYTLAANISAAPGPGGAPLNMPVEVRQIGVAPPVDAT